jgi:hypothetical protein
MWPPGSAFGQTTSVTLPIEAGKRYGLRVYMTAISRTCQIALTGITTG